MMLEGNLDDVSTDLALIWAQSRPELMHPVLIRYTVSHYLTNSLIALKLLPLKALVQ